MMVLVLKLGAQDGTCWVLEASQIAQESCSHHHCVPTHRNQN